MGSIGNKALKILDIILERASSGNIRKKANFVAYVSCFLVIVVVIGLTVIGFREFDVSVPLEGVISRTIDKDTLEITASCEPIFLNQLKTGQPAYITVVTGQDKIKLSGQVLAMDRKESVDQVSFHFKSEEVRGRSFVKNTSVKSRVVVDKRSFFDVCVK